MSRCRGVAVAVPQPPHTQARGCAGVRRTHADGHRASDRDHVRSHDVARKPARRRVQLFGPRSCHAAGASQWRSLSRRTLRLVDALVFAELMLTAIALPIATM